MSQEGGMEKDGCDGDELLCPIPPSITPPDIPPSGSQEMTLSSQIQLLDGSGTERER